MFELVVVVGEVGCRAKHRVRLSCDEGSETSHSELLSDSR